MIGLPQLWKASSPQLAGASAAIHFKAASSQLFLTLSINNVSLFSSFPTLSLYVSDWLVRFFKSFSCRWMSKGCCQRAVAILFVCTVKRFPAVQLYFPPHTLQNRFFPPLFFKVGIGPKMTVQADKHVWSGLLCCLLCNSERNKRPQTRSTAHITDAHAFTNTRACTACCHGDAIKI